MTLLLLIVKTYNNKGNHSFAEFRQEECMLWETLRTSICEMTIDTEDSAFHIGSFNWTAQQCSKISVSHVGGGNIE